MTGGPAAAPDPTAASPRRALLIVAVLLLAVPVLRPPEVSPIAAFVVETLAAVALLLAGRLPAVLPPDARAAALLLLPLAAGAVLLAPGRARAVDEAAAVAQFLVCLGLGAQVSRQPALRRLLPILLLALGTAASAQAIAQHHWAWPRAASELRAQGPPADASADAMLVRLESGRPSGPFVLPTALAGFLALTIPATLLVALGATGITRAGAVVAIAVQGDAFLMTRSLGGLGALACALAVVLIAGNAWRARRVLPAAAVVAALVGIVTAGFLSLRRGEMTSSPGADPWTLRAGNWGAAARMIGDHPLFGVGPGAFGTFYPRYMRPGMNETRYAHNSYLQLAATWGLWILLPIGAGVAAFVARARRADPRDAGRMAALAGGAAFLAHNLVDFTFYQPGVALPCALLIGCSSVAADGPPAEPRDRTGASGRGGAMLAWCVALLFFGHAFVAGRSALWLDRAGDAAGHGDLVAARDDARRAALARPGDPLPWAFLSELLIALPGGDPQTARDGRLAAERAAALDPESAVRHHVLALYHAQDGEPASAWLEERRAHELFPLKPQYDDAAGAAPAR